MKVSLLRRTLRFREPVATAYGELRERELLELKLGAAHGHTGVGEAAPLPAYDGVGMDDVRAALQDCRPLLEEAGGDDDREALLDACREAAVLPQAVAAIDVALWDLAGRRARRPLWALLGARGATPVAVNATIGAVDRAGAASAAAQAVARGFRCVKAKVGVGDDAGRVAAIRAAAGPEVAIRLDANGAWDVEEAVAGLRTLAPAGIECCEEPAHGVAALREIAARSEVPIAMDETAAQPGALESGACAAVCLKLARCGGVSGLIDAAGRVRAAGGEVYLASSFDGPIGIAAALHAAAAIEPDRACGLATLELFEGLEADPRAAAVAAVDGAMRPPDGPGLGL